VPKNVEELIAKGGKRYMEAMMKMKKLDMAALEKAARGE
jgi:predicted 3-demethylubiquinone-9 3-methyltransferase (glyoxalase superfamily)